MIICNLTVASGSLAGEVGGAMNCCGAGGSIGNLSLSRAIVSREIQKLTANGNINHVTTLSLYLLFTAHYFYSGIRVSRQFNPEQLF